MSTPGRQMHIRLPDHIGKKFDALASEFAGLAPGTVLRLLISDQLEKSLNEQVAIVARQIKKPRKDQPARRNRIKLNASSEE